jgi:hypothetical protein
LASPGRSRRRPLGALTSLCAAGLIAACQTVIGASFDDVEPKSSSAQCNSKRPPGPTVDTPQGGNIEFTALASTIDYGESTTAKGTKPPSLGYDLDQSCTNHGDAPLCTPPAYTKGDPTDGPSGEDNSVARLVGGEYSELGLDPAPVSSEALTTGMKAGKYAPVGLFHVSGYVGYDDDSVDVEWYVPLAAKFDPDGAFVPKLDGSDVWPVLSADGDGGATPLIFKAKRAYVVNRGLVAFFDDGRIPFVNSYFVVHDVVLTATLDSGSGKTVLSDALIAGWGPSHELLKLLPGFTFELFGAPLCTNLAIYGQQIKPWLCAKLDQAKEPGANGICDSFSFGIGFASVPVSVGKAAPIPTQTACPAQFSPEDDDCAKPPVVGDGGNPFDAGN